MVAGRVLADVADGGLDLLHLHGEGGLEAHGIVDTDHGEAPLQQIQSGLQLVGAFPAEVPAAAEDIHDHREGAVPLVGKVDVQQPGVLLGGVGRGGGVLHVSLGQGSLPLGLGFDLGDLLGQAHSRRGPLVRLLLPVVGKDHAGIVGGAVVLIRRRLPLAVRRVEGGQHPVTLGRIADVQVFSADKGRIRRKVLALLIDEFQIASLLSSPSRKRRGCSFHVAAERA